MLAQDLFLMLSNGAVAPQNAGSEYLQRLPREARRSAGQVYTPPGLVDFILDLAQYTPGNGIEKARFIDPACGAGAFLVEAVTRMSEALRQGGCDFRRPVGLAALSDAIEKHIFGVDIDADACRLAIEAVRRKFREITGREAEAGFFGTNVVNQDFLLGDLSGLRRGGFSFVVGNPPYVAANRISETLKVDLRARFKTASGRLDLYTMFFERGIQFLGSGGRLAYITPNKYLASSSARPLRAHIAESCTIRAIANFRSHRVFANAATVPCVTLLEKRRSQEQLELMDCRVQVADGRISKRTTFAIDQPESDAPWYLTDPRLAELALLIRGKHPKLEDVSSRVSAGIATGLDSLFVFREEETLDLEPELLKRAVRGRDVAAFRIQDPRLRVVIPYLRDEAGTPRLVDIRQFPRVRERLEMRKKELLSRHCVRKWNKAWYDIHDPWMIDIAAATKVMVPDVASSNRFALDDGNFCPLHSVYYIVPKEISPTFLTAVLNSKPLEFLVRLHAPVVKDGFSRYRKQFLVSLPIPKVEPRVERNLLDAVERGDFEQADDIASEMFGLSPTRAASIKAFLQASGTVH